MDLENTELSQKNSQNQDEMQELNQRLAEILCQKEKEPADGTFKDWEQENSNLKEELERCKVQVWRQLPYRFFWRKSQEIEIFVLNYVFTKP